MRPRPNYSRAGANRDRPRALPMVGQQLRREVTRLGLSSGGGGGVTDHGALTGLADNDHPQYARVEAGAFTTLAPTSAVAATTGTNELARIVEVEGLITAFYGVLTAGYQPLDMLLTDVLSAGIDVDEIWYGVGASNVSLTALTSFGRSLIDDGDASQARTTLGLGSLATQSGTFSGTSSGTNTGDQTITLTGDVTGSGTGSFAATIANDAVTMAKLQNSAAAGRSVIGRSTNSAGDFAEIATTTDGDVLRLSGTTLGFGTVATAGIAADAVTNAKLANMTQGTIKGRADGAGTGDPTDLTALQAAVIVSPYFADIAHTHDGTQVSLDDSGWGGGALDGSGVRDVQQLADWINANFVP